MKLLKEYIKNDKKTFLFSFIVALGLTFGNYAMNNMPLFTGEDLDIFAWLQLFKDRISDNETDIDITKDALFVNVAYDKELVPYCDADSFLVGEIDVTSRQKLNTFLNILKANPTYKYILLDVRFEKGVGEDLDLFTTINSMNNIVVASQSDIQTTSLIDSEKLALAEYYSTITATNFVTILC